MIPVRNESEFELLKRCFGHYARHGDQQMPDQIHMCIGIPTKYSVLYIMGFKKVLLDWTKIWFVRISVNRERRASGMINSNLRGESAAFRKLQNFVPSKG